MEAWDVGKTSYRPKGRNVIFSVDRKFNFVSEIVWSSYKNNVNSWSTVGQKKQDCQIKNKKSNEEQLVEGTQSST